MASCNGQWILLGLLCGVLLQSTSADDNRIEFLIPIKQTERGVLLTLIPSTVDESPIFGTKLVPDQQLSSDCGDQFFRCEPLPVATQITSNTTVYQLFVPLNGGILVVELRFSTNISKMVLGPHRILETHICSPTTIFKLYDSYYTMCTDLQNALVTLYEIRVNKTLIEQTEITGPIATVGGLDGFMSSSVVNMSNFLVSTDVVRLPLVYFAIDNYLFAIDPLDYSVNTESNPVNVGASCRYIHRLARVSHSQLLAYCSSQFIYFDMEQQDWLSEHSYIDSGVPYPCPNDMYGVNVFHNYLEYSVGSSRMGTLSHINANSGMCFNGTGGRSYFAYSDKINDSTTLIDLTSGRIQTTFCKNLNCLPVLAVEDPIRYLIIRQPSNDGRVNVLDVATNFSTIISADHHDTSDMFTIIRVKAPLQPSPPGPDGQITTHIIGGVFGALAAAIVVIVIVTIAITRRCMHDRRCVAMITEETVTPTPETQAMPCTPINHQVDMPQGQPQTQDSPAPESHLGRRGNYMQAGGNNSSNLGRIGEDEKDMYEQKQLEKDSNTVILSTYKSMYGNYDDKKPSSIDPEAILADSTSLATVPSNGLASEAISDHSPQIAQTTAADSISDDTGSEDSGMNSDKQPLLDN